MMQEHVMNYIGGGGDTNLYHLFIIKHVSYFISLLLDRTLACMRAWEHRSMPCHATSSHTRPHNPWHVCFQGPRWAAEGAQHTAGPPPPSTLRPPCPPPPNKQNHNESSWVGMTHVRHMHIVLARRHD